MNNLRTMRKNILGRDVANELLRGFYPDFIACVQHGLNQMASVPPRLQAELRPRTLANLLNDFVVKQAERQFSEEKNVMIDNKHEGTFFIFHNLIALRFKKVNANQEPRNYPTQRQVELAWQYRQLEGFARLTVVNVGYVLNKVWSAIESVSVSCRRGDDLEWEIPIADVLEGYMFDSDGNAQTRKAVVRAKVAEKARSNG